MITFIIVLGLAIVGIVLFQKQKNKKPVSKKRAKKSTSYVQSKPKAPKAK